MNNIGLLLSFVLAVSTAWLALARFQTKPDNNWPLVYYFVLVGYLNAYDLVLNPNVVYVAVICALLLRFEFMNERVVFFVRLVEVATLINIGYSLIGVILRAMR
ncbi:MAG TPA: hypothetical protein VGK29_23900 [Paludibaculum sp.]|jgi:hypothetical protein